MSIGTKLIYQGLMKLIVTKYGGVEYLPLLKPQACVRAPTKIHQPVDRTQPSTHNKRLNVPKALKWARLATKTIPKSTTAIVINHND
jgi:hypothetical protein